LPRVTVHDKIVEIVEKSVDGQSDNFDNFKPELYSVWNFGKATNEVKHFGNIPPEIVENLLYYYTSPGDVVFDPFGGGGSTIDVCSSHMRRYYVSDLKPIPARDQEIRPHDITTGLPDMPVPHFVFLDPPYWKQAAGKYSDSETDLGNMELAEFLTVIGDVVKAIKRKWKDRKSGTLALIIGAYDVGDEYVDLALLCHQCISKYMTLKRRVIVPYSTEQWGGAHVKRAKEKKRVLNLHRDLMVYGI
jgi:DNA modification methylase